MTDEELLAQFHTMWDGFPGMARLITKDHVILASNQQALDKGFAPGLRCATVGDPKTHRGCKLNAMFDMGTGQTDRIIPDRVRGWSPIAGRDDVCVHFAVLIPDE